MKRGLYSIGISTIVVVNITNRACGTPPFDLGYSRGSPRALNNRLTFQEEALWEAHSRP
jgi:hypothetical protein